MKHPARQRQAFFLQKWQLISRWVKCKTMLFKIEYFWSYLQDKVLVDTSSNPFSIVNSPEGNPMLIQASATASLYRPSSSSKRPSKPKADDLGQSELFRVFAELSLLLIKRFLELKVVNHFSLCSSVKQLKKLSFSLSEIWYKPWPSFVNDTHRWVEGQKIS